MQTSPKNTTLIFFKEALKEFKTRGALFPSSKFLGRRIAEMIEMKPGIILAELGAGTGVFTREILARLPKDGRFIVFEISPGLSKALKEEFGSDQRVTLIQDDAVKLGKYLNDLDLDGADCIVSGLPLGDFNHETRENLLTAIHSSLKEKGMYIQFQYLLSSLMHIRKFFRTKIVALEFRNLPPAFVYKCRKC